MTTTLDRLEIPSDERMELSLAHVTAVSAEHELTEDQLAAVNGGIAPLLIAAGFALGFGAGLTVGIAIGSSKS